MHLTVSLWSGEASILICSTCIQCWPCTGPHLHMKRHPQEVWSLDSTDRCGQQMRCCRCAHTEGRMQNPLHRSMRPLELAVNGNWCGKSYNVPATVCARWHYTQHLLLVFTRAPTGNICFLIWLQHDHTPTTSHMYICTYSIWGMSATKEVCT